MTRSTREPHAEIGHLRKRLGELTATRSTRELHAEIEHLRKRLDVEGYGAGCRILALETELGAEKARNAADREELREAEHRREETWLGKWRIAEQEISALHTAIGRESQRNLTTPCATCGKPSGLKTPQVIQCLECFRGIAKKPKVCLKDCIALGGGTFKCAKPVGHQDDHEGVTQDGLLARENVGEVERRADPEEVRELEKRQAAEDARGIGHLVTFEPDPSPPTSTIVVTASDGKRYEIKTALLVQAVIETGQINPLDGLPIFAITSQIVTQTKAKTDA